MNNKLIT